MSKAENVVEWAGLTYWENLRRDRIWGVRGDGHALAVRGIFGGPSLAVVRVQMEKVPGAPGHVLVRYLGRYPSRKWQWRDRR